MMLRDAGHDPDLELVFDCVLASDEIALYGVTSG